MGDPQSLQSATKIQHLSKRTRQQHSRYRHLPEANSESLDLLDPRNLPVESEGIRGQHKSELLLR